MNRPAIKVLPDHQRIAASDQHVKAEAVSAPKSERSANFKEVNNNLSTHSTSTWLRGDACTTPSLGRVADSTEYELSDLYELTLVADNMPQAFESKLRQRLEFVLQLYEVMLGQSNLSRVSIHITVFRDEALYEQEIQSMGSSSRNTRGQYSSKYARAIVHAENPEQGLRTAIHEIIHILNHAMIGRTGRWLNEGLAEYFENLTFNGRRAIVNLSHDWTVQKRLTLEPVYDFMWLNGTEGFWKYPGLQRQQLYANSWLWVYYLMEEHKRFQAMANLLRYEQSEPCTHLTINQAYHQILYNARDFESNFYSWMQQPFQRHKWGIQLR